MRLLVASLAFTLFADVALATIYLDFDGATPGTINDANGLGTGFTDRLPGSGSSIPENDPNLDLDTVAGHLLVTSTRSDFSTSGFGRNLTAMEAPALLLDNIGSQNFLVRAKFLNLHADQLSDQVGIFVGSSVDNVVREGIHEGPSGYQAFLIRSQNGVEAPPSLGTDNQFQAGQDGLFELGRVGGQWHYKWTNLSDPSFSGSFNNILLPALDAETDLFVGIFNNDARNTVSQTVALDYFTVVPEPTSSLILASVFSVILFVRRQRMT